MKGAIAGQCPADHPGVCGSGRLPCPEARSGCAIRSLPRGPTATVGQRRKRGGLPGDADAGHLRRRERRAAFAAATAVVGEVRAGIGPVESLLDAGAGTGAAALAAREHFPEAAITMIERQAAPAEAARQWLPGAIVLSGDVAHMGTLAPHDLVRSEEHTSELQSLRHLVCRL